MLAGQRKLLGRIAAILAGVKAIVVAWRNCNLWKPLGMIMCEKLTSNRVHHSANSRAGAEYIAGKLGLSPERFTVIYNGIDCARYAIRADRKEVFEGLAIPADAPIVTMVASLTRQKNYPMFLNTAQKAKAAGLPVHFVIVGSGMLQDALIELARRLEVTDRVHFAGLRKDVPQVLAASDIFLFTTDYEGFPNALLEAMAAGLPVITTDFAGVKELVTGPDVGTIVPLNDAEAAVTAIRNCLEDPERADAVGRNAQRFIQATFAMSVMVEKTIAFYHKLLEQ